MGVNSDTVNTASASEAGTGARTVWYNNNGTWVECYVYCYQDGQWVLCSPYYNSGDAWV